MVLEQLIANAPERWEGYYNLGLLNWLKGDRAKALAFWQEGLKADPYNQQLKAALQNAR
jgi:tetratricopeptide (TPR) repeat protein